MYRLTQITKAYHTPVKHSLHQPMTNKCKWHPGTQRSQQQLTTFQLTQHIVWSLQHNWASCRNSNCNPSPIARTGDGPFNLNMTVATHLSGCFVIYTIQLWNLLWSSHINLLCKHTMWRQERWQKRKMSGVVTVTRSTEWKHHHSLHLIWLPISLSK